MADQSMALITLRIIDGADRGREYQDVRTPVTIGREEGNTIQLNDDRVSRYHAKIQEDHDKIVLTDLESTNGTLVNGEETQIRILRFGDKITVGRTVIIFGSRDEIAERLASLRDRASELGTARGTSLAEELKKLGSLDFELGWSENPDLQSTLHMLEPPRLPERLDAVQSAQLSELIEFLHMRIRHLLATVRESSGGEQGRVSLDFRQWQNLIDIQARLATYLTAIADRDREIQ